MLRLKVFTLRFSDRLDGFSDEPLVDFVRDKDVVELREHFFQRDGTPYWAVMVVYRMAVPTSPIAPQTPRTVQVVRDWREGITEADWPLYNALREWRSERAKADGLPVYVIGTNRQLAEIVAKKPQSLQALGALDGMGEAKLKRYGPDILRIVSTKRGPPAATPAPQPPPPPPPPKESPDGPGTKTP